MNTFKNFISRHDSIFLSSIATILSIVMTWWYYTHGQIIAYGDAESHLNIAKRVISSVTPGLAQLGGIWLPLPHLLMVPFVSLDTLWRTGLAGSIVSGISFVISSVFLYKLVHTITKKKFAALIAYLVFITNANVLYMQTTPMTELLLITFFILSTYYFYRFLSDRDDTISLLNAAFFGFAATLTRYDGWFLVGIEALSIAILFMKYPSDRKKLEGRFILFCTLAFFGIVLWLLWNLLILGDPFYFTSSPFSAKSQQQSWMARGELETQHNLWLSMVYYAGTAYANVTGIITALSGLGLIAFFLKKETKEKAIFFLVLAVPAIFYVLTLFMGQSVIFIPGITPKSFEWNLFNVRYGLMMVPVAAVLVGYVASVKKIGFLIAFVGIIAQLVLTLTISQPPITLQDGITGLSSAKVPDAQSFMTKHYSGGMVLMDDYARTMSLVRSTIPMNESIYIGNKPYWEDSLIAPEKYATWIVMQKNDAVWVSIYDEEETRGRLFKYFKKSYTSPEILIFERNGVAL